MNCTKNDKLYKELLDNLSIVDVNSYYFSIYELLLEIVDTLEEIRGINTIDLIDWENGKKEKDYERDTISFSINDTYKLTITLDYEEKDCFLGEEDCKHKVVKISEHDDFFCLKNLHEKLITEADIHNNIKES